MYQSHSIIIDRGISSPRHGKEVVYVINAVDKRYIYKFLSTVQIPGSKIFDLWMQIHTGTQNDDVSLAKEIQHFLTKTHRKDGVIDQVKNSKQLMERKWIDIKYRVQDNADVAHQDVKCIVAQINSKNYHFVFHIPNLMAQGG